MFKSKTPGIIAAAALAVGVFGSASAAQAGVDSTEPQSDIIAILKADSGGDPQTQSDIIAILKADSAGDPQDLVLSMRKAGGDPQ